MNPSDEALFLKALGEELLTREEVERLINMRLLAESRAKDINSAISRRFLATFSEGAAPHHPKGR